MPIDYKLYPPNWKTEIRPRILARAWNKCENCGAENYKPHPITGSRVVLTIMHLDHDPKNHEIRDDRLMAACQRCHLSYDRSGQFPESDPKEKKCSDCEKSTADKNGIPVCSITKRPGWLENPRFDCSRWEEIKEGVAGTCKCGNKAEKRYWGEPICDRCLSLQSGSCRKRK